MSDQKLGQILEKLCVRSGGHIFSRIIMKLGQNVYLNEISEEFKNGSRWVKNVGLKTRSLGQILEKPYVHSRGHIFSPIIMKFGQNVCLDKISDEFEKGHVRLKTRSLGQIFGKPCVRCRGHIFSLIIMKLGQNVCLMKSQTSSKMGHVWSRTMSLGQILEKPCVCSRGYIFSLIIMELGQNVCPDETLHDSENGLCWVKN